MPLSTAELKQLFSRKLQVGKVLLVDPLRKHSIHCCPRVWGNSTAFPVTGGKQVTYCAEDRDGKGWLAPDLGTVSHGR